MNLTTLVRSWLTDPPTQRERLPHLHIQLWRAVAQECTEKMRLNIIIHPTQDPKVKWAEQFLDKLQGERKTICPHIEASARFLTGLPIEGESGGEAQPSGKMLAAHDL
jgi:hypothetical protein